MKSLTLPLLQQNYLDLQQNYRDPQQSSAELPEWEHDEEEMQHLHGDWDFGDWDFGKAT